MAKVVDEKPYDPELAEGKSWTPTKLTGIGLVTLLIALSLIVFFATRMTTCMYLDGSQP